MASTTTNYGLTKPAYSDTADIATQNTNMDKIDTALGGLDAGIAIVANGNTHAAISEGQYVYIRGHNSLAEGLYRATANIAANGTLSGSNVTSAVMGTALAALSGSTVKYTDVIDNLTSSETSKPLSAKQGKTLSDQMGNEIGLLTPNQSLQLSTGKYIYDKAAHTVRIFGCATSNDFDVNASTVLATVPQGYRPSGTIYILGVIITSSGVSFYDVTVGANGVINQRLTSYAKSVLFLGEYSI